ncbi:MAG: glycogen-binding domain-containing protein [Gemmatimonadaceae bacterium]
MARTRWCASVAMVLSCAPAGAASAQVTFGTGLRASTSNALGRDRWHANQVVASALRFDRSWLALGSDGAVLRDQRGVWRTAGSLEGALLVAAPLGARVALVSSLGEPARDSALYPSRLVVGTRLSRRIGAGGAWLAADLARPMRGEAAHTADLTSGLWRQVGSALLTVSLSSRARGAARGWAAATRTFMVDTAADSAGTTVPRSHQDARQDSTALVARRWSEAEGRLFWAGGRWSLDVAVRGRLAAAGIDAALWATADAALLVTPRVALVGGVGTAPGGLTPTLPAHRHASLDVRLMRAAPLARALPVELQPVAVGFEVKELEPGRYRVALRVPRARVVEVTGDFTAWKPVALQRGSSDWWEIALPITPGTHLVNVRINGEGWVAPPGATVVDDDFAGVVGVIVVR